MAAVNLPGLQPAADLVQQQQQQVAAVAAPNTDNPQKLSGAANNQAVTGLTPNSNSQRFKFVIIGEPSVGKTALFTKYIYSTFENGYQATIGIDFLSKTIFRNNQSLRLQLWDTAGQERFTNLVPSYVREAHVVFIAFDLSNHKSFEMLPKHLGVARQYQARDDMKIILVGTKLDLEAQRQVSVEEAQAFAQENNIDYKEVSAMLNTGVDALFDFAIEKLPIQPINVSLDPAGLNIPGYDNILTNNKTDEPNGRCCLFGG